MKVWILCLKFILSYVELTIEEMVTTEQFQNFSIKISWNFKTYSLLKNSAILKVHIIIYMLM